MAVTELRRIPGVGKQTEQDLLALGYSSMEELRFADPEELYIREQAMKGAAVDRCQLYVYRCAVYFCRTERPEPEKCKWRYWKDKKLEDEYV